MLNNIVIKIFLGDLKTKKSKFFEEFKNIVFDINSRNDDVFREYNYYKVLISIRKQNLEKLKNHLEIIYKKNDYFKNYQKVNIDVHIGNQKIYEVIKIKNDTDFENQKTYLSKFLFLIEYSSKIGKTLKINNYIKLIKKIYKNEKFLTLLNSINHNKTFAQNFKTKCKYEKIFNSKKEKFKNSVNKSDYIIFEWYLKFIELFPNYFQIKQLNKIFLENKYNYNLSLEFLNQRICVSIKNSVLNLNVKIKCVKKFEENLKIGFNKRKNIKQKKLFAASLMKKFTNLNKKSTEIKAKKINVLRIFKKKKFSSIESKKNSLKPIINKHKTTYLCDTRLDNKFIRDELDLLIKKRHKRNSLSLRRKRRTYENIINEKKSPSSEVYSKINENFKILMKLKQEQQKIIKKKNRCLNASFFKIRNKKKTSKENIF